jgi:hypothetical protein
MPRLDELEWREFDESKPSDPLRATRRIGYLNGVPIVFERVSGLYSVYRNGPTSRGVSGDFYHDIDALTAQCILFHFFPPTDTIT